MNESNNKRIAKNTLLLYVRMLFMMVIGLYTSRVILDKLGEVDFGIYNVVGGFVTMFAVISGAMTSATQRFLSFEIGKGKEGNVKGIFSTMVYIHLFLALVILFLGEVVGVWFLNAHMNFPVGRYEAANWVFQLSLLVFILNVINVPYNGALIAYEKMSAFAYFSIFDAIFKLAICYVITLTPFDKLIVYAALMALIQIALLLMYFFYCKNKFKECKFTGKFNKEYGRNVGSFVSWNLIGSLAGIAKEQGVNVVLNMFFGPAVNAARGLSVQVKTAVSNFAMGFFTAVRPQIVKSYAAGDTSRFTELIFNSGKFTFFLLWLICLPVMLRIDNILLFWLGNVPDWTAQFVIWILIFNLINCSFCDPMWQGIQAIGELKKYVAIGSFIYFLAFPITWIAFKFNGSPLLAFQILVLVRICYFIITTLIFRKYSYFSLYKYAQSVLSPVLKVVIVSLILSFLINEVMPYDFISTVIVCLLTVFLVGFSIYIVGLNLNERVLLLETIKKKLCRH